MQHLKNYKIYILFPILPTCSPLLSAFKKIENAETNTEMSFKTQCTPISVIIDYSMM
jgi:hypothetical protein